MGRRDIVGGSSFMPVPSMYGNPTARAEELTVLRRSSWIPSTLVLQLFGVARGTSILRLF